MPDITLCRDHTCPQKESCYRFLAEPEKYWQSYFAESPRNGDECRYYWEVEEKTLKTKTDKL